jgi:hypothetical protein
MKKTANQLIWDERFSLGDARYVVSTDNERIPAVTWLLCSGAGGMSTTRRNRRLVLVGSMTRQRLTLQHTLKISNS